MKKICEFLRFFFISIEFALVCTSLMVYVNFAHGLESAISSLKISNDGIKVLVAIPPGICAWTYISGRKLLFPDKDKRNILLEWPQYWRLKIGFNVGLTWSTIFAAIAISLWFFDLQKITPTLILMLLTSILGVIITFIGIYNAHNFVEFAVSNYVKNKT